MTRKYNEDRRVSKKSKNGYVSIGMMRVSPAGISQRRFNQKWADTLAANFDLDSFRRPVVNKRGSHYYIIDGQHSVDALKQWIGDGWEGQQVECEIYCGLTEQEEAELFDRLNNVKAVNTFDRFRVRVTAGYKIETHINKIVKKEGLVISSDKVPGRIMAVGTLRKVYTRAGAENLGRALRIIRDSYGDAGLDASVIDGMGHLCQRYNGQLDDAVAVERLSKARGGVSGLLAKAEVTRKQTGQPKGHCVAASAVDIINANRGGKKIPSWWKTSND